jgi:predicted PurR-regulated permease PerM
MLNDRLQAAVWLGLGLALLCLLYLLSPILAPFLLAGILAYICDPLVGRLEHHGLARAAGVAIVMTLLLTVLILLVLILVPLIRDESALLAARLPDAIAIFNENAAPWLKQHLGISIKLNNDFFRRLLTDNWDSAQSIAAHLLESLKIGGVALFGLLANLLLAPVVMFYLLRDWKSLLGRLGRVVPQRWQAKTFALLGDIDKVLAEFLRGQISVMLLLALYYSFCLWLAGIDFALPVGLLTGLLVFVPYLGYACGLVLALLVAILKFAGIEPVIWVLGIYGIGQLLESFILTPYLVGERIGLHPLAVIFALLAFGQLFGFAGILLALPASAALLVGLREVRNLYLASNFYKGGM